MAEIGPLSVSVPMHLGGVKVADIDLPITISRGSNIKNLSVDLTDDSKRIVADTLRAVAHEIEPLRVPEGTFPIKWVTGIDETLEWPTTPGSAVLADRHCGAGPQVLILAKTERDNSSASQEHRWWGGHEDKAAYPIAGAWSHNRPTSGYDLLQILHVAP